MRTLRPSMFEGARSLRSSKYRFRIILAALILLGGLGFVMFQSQREREAIRKEIARELEALRAKDVPITANDMCKSYPDPPPEEDVSVLLSESFRLLVSPQPRANLPILGGASLPKGTNRMPPYVQEHVSGYVLDNAAAYEALPAKWPGNARFPGYWCDSFPKQRTIPLVEVRRLVQTLALRALYYAEEGNAGESINSFEWIVRISKALPKEDAVTYMIGRACLGLAVEGLKRVLNQCQLTEPELVRLQEILRENELVDLHLDFPGERCRAIWCLESARNDQELALIVGPEEMKPLVRLKRLVGLAPPLYRDDDYLTYVKNEVVYVQSLSLPWRERIHRMQQIDDNGRAARSAAGRAIMRGNWEKLVRTASETSARMLLLQTAVAVERYRLQSGRLPENLEEINPEFFSVPPRDPFDEQPLRYQRRMPGYLIYSVGADGIDNGGAEKPRNTSSTVEYDLSVIVDR